MNNRWIGEKEKEKNAYEESQADPTIIAHAIHWLICIETYKSVRNPGIGTSSKWVLEYNEKETCIYKQECSGSIIIGFRGTHAAKDLYDDAKITMGQVFPRAKEAIEMIKSIIEENPNKTIELCGHSLGGAIAREAGKELKLGVVTFNAAAPPTAPAISGQNEVDYHIMFDIISAWQSPNTIRIDKGYKPIPSFWQRMNFYLNMWVSMGDLIEAHNLSNFSNEKSGKIVSGQEETKSMNGWLNSLPKEFRPYVLAFLFGITGSLWLPEIE